MMGIFFLISMVYYYYQSTTPPLPALKNCRTISSLTQAFDIFSTLKHNDIVFFDVDDTLLSAHDLWAGQFNPPMLFKIAACIRYPRFLYDRTFGEKIFSKMMLHAPRILIEPATPKIIAKLRKQGVIVMVITAMETGSFGLIPSLPE